MYDNLVYNKINIVRASMKPISTEVDKTVRSQARKTKSYGALLT